MMRKADYTVLAEKFRLKYFLDRCLAAVLLVITAPLFALAAVLILVDGWLHPENRGSIFYKEPRMSSGKVFKIVKFRTVSQKTIRWIRQDADKRSITGCADVTWSGKIILKWYMDELPQMINILMGEMSFIGPRPHVIEQSREEVEDAGLVYRKHIRAGLLGIVQAMKRDRGYKDMFKRMAETHSSYCAAINKMDALYANKCLEKSPIEIAVFDIYLMVRGIITVFKGVSK